MKNCSACGMGNEEAAAACVGCGAVFPEVEADSQLQDPSLVLVTVANCRDAVEAGLVKARLDAAGIEACVPEEFSPHLLPSFFPNAAEPVTVRVLAQDSDAAQKLLAEEVSPPAVGD